MVDDQDIYRVAQLVIDGYGDGAEVHAQSRADELAQQGDEVGQMVWLGIAEAIRVLQATEPEGTVH